MKEHLGSGQFGQVDKGIWSSPDGPVDVAIKTLRSEASEEEKIKFLQEAAIMGQFHHANIVILHGMVTVTEPVSMNDIFKSIYNYFINIIDYDCVRTSQKWRSQRVSTHTQTNVSQSLCAMIRS